MLQYFETILSSVKSLFNFFYRMRYLLWMVVLLEVCDVTKHGRHLGRYLGFYQELEIR